jgi:hypothetical protein
MSFGASPVTQRGTLGEELKRKDWGIERLKWMSTLVPGSSLSSQHPGKGTCIEGRKNVE